MILRAHMHQGQARPNHKKSAACMPNQLRQYPRPHKTCMRETNTKNIQGAQTHRRCNTINNQDPTKHHNRCTNKILQQVRKYEFVPGNKARFFKVAFVALPQIHLPDKVKQRHWDRCNPQASSQQSCIKLQNPM